MSVLNDPNETQILPPPFKATVQSLMANAARRPDEGGFIDSSDFQMLNGVRSQSGPAAAEVTSQPFSLASR